MATTFPSLSADPEYRAFVAAVEAAPEDRTARAALADWLQDRGHDAQAAAFRASAEDATEYGMVPTRHLGGYLVQLFHVHRYHDAERTSYSFVGVWPTLLEAVAAFVRWHMRGEWETQCRECDNGAVDTGGRTPWGQPLAEACNYCKGETWLPACEHGNCEQPGEACGGTWDGEMGPTRDEPEAYFCLMHAVDAGYCRSCRCPIGLEGATPFCGECEWEARSDAQEEDDNDLTDDPDYEDDAQGYAGL